MNARVIQVIELTDVSVGVGTGADPYRGITCYWSTDGNLLAEVDHFKAEQKGPPCPTCIFWLLDVRQCNLANQPENDFSCYKAKLA